MPNPSFSLPISVVIPAHNEAEFIRQAIESVGRQTLPVGEVIVVADDCSDDTAGIAGDAGAAVTKIKARNISAARNAGVRAARHDWIAFLDADDYWAPEKIECQWKAIKAFPQAAVVSCDFHIVYQGETVPLSKKALQRRRQHFSTPPVITSEGTYFSDVDGRVLTAFEIGPQAVIIRRDVFGTSGYFDEGLDYLQDIEYFARVLKDHAFVMIEQPLVFRRLRPDSHSADREAKWLAFLSLVERMLRHADQYVPLAGDQYREHLKFIFASNERVLAQLRQSTR